MSMQRQSGKAVAMIMFAILIVAFFLTVAFKLGPLYMNYGTVGSVLNNMVEEAEMGSGIVENNVRSIHSYITRNLDINGVSGFKKEDFLIKRLSDKTTEVSVSYERREHLFFNIDAVVVFEKSVELVF